MTKTLIVVLGPTAIGKTAMGIQLAKAFGTEIISADSRQFFKEMKIGTAVPTEDELALVKHHFIQHKSIHEHYSVGDYEQDALRTIEELFRKKDTIIVVGGSGLYVKAITEGLDYFPKIKEGIREKLQIELETYGIKKLQDELEDVDPDYFAAVQKENPHRLIRALEVYRSSGQTFSSFLGKKRGKRNFECIKIGLEAPREVVYNRINKRVDIMLEEGLVEEVKTLIPYKTKNALNTVGYKELFDYFEGKLSLEAAIEEIKKNTRRFAKRQFTWFRNQEELKWFDYQVNPKKIIEEIEIEKKTKNN